MRLRLADFLWEGSVIEFHCNFVSHNHGTNVREELEKYRKLIVGIYPSIDLTNFGLNCFSRIIPIYSFCYQENSRLYRFCHPLADGRYPHAYNIFLPYYKTAANHLIQSDLSSEI